MPEDHRKYLEWDGDRFRRWGEQIGPSTARVIDAILTSGRIEQQSYRSCMGLLKLVDKHTSVKLEAACKKALEYTGKPRYKSIKDLLTNLKDKLPASSLTEIEGTPEYSGLFYTIVPARGYR